MNEDCRLVTVGHGLHETRCEHVQLIVFDSTTYHHQCRVLSVTSVLSPIKQHAGGPVFNHPVLMS
jgi:hypothetical protein